MMKLVWITSAQYMGGYTLKLSFNDGANGIVDLSSYVEDFEPLKCKEIFRNFQLGGWTVSWLDGRIDIAPEALYDRLQVCP